MTDEAAWDHIIVGGRSAGCTLTRRLAESGRRVLLVEAGPDTPPGAVPAAVPHSYPAYPGVANFDPRLNWQALRVTLGAGDSGAVVDEACRMRGITGLRAVDTCVTPSLPRADTHLPTIMVAEDAAAGPPVTYARPIGL
ncbi:MAG: GMC oxidoreductase [Alphaproteobacteria bacterium]